MFNPRHGLISNEPCESLVSWTLDTGQLLDGTLRLSPFTTKYERTETNMVEMDWDNTWDFETGDTTGWLFNGNYAIEDGKLRLHAECFYENTEWEWEDAYGRARILHSNESMLLMDNTNGWSLETTIACEGCTQFIIRDGTRSFRGRMGERRGIRGIWLNPVGEPLYPAFTGDFVFPLENFGIVTGISSMTSYPEQAAEDIINYPGLSVTRSVPIITRTYKDIRFSVKGGDLTIDCDGLSTTFEDTDYLWVDTFRGHEWLMSSLDQQSGWVSYSDPEPGQSQDSVPLDKLYFGRGDLWIERYRVSSSFYQPVKEISKWAIVSWPTQTQTAYTPVYTPDPGITRFQNAVYRAENVTGDGTLFITPQYQYGAGAWNDGTRIQITDEYTTQSLAAFQPVGDGDDKIRFKAEQASNTGDGPSPRLDDINVTVSRKDSGVYKHTPSWGPKEGANTVAFDIFRSPSGMYYGTGDVFILDHDDVNVGDESLNALTVTEVGTVAKNVSYVNLISSMADVSGAPWATILGTATNPGDGLTVSGTTTEVVQRRHPKTTDLIYVQRVVGNNQTHFVKIDAIGTLVVGTVYILEFAIFVNQGIVRLEIPSTGYDNGSFHQGDARLVRVAFEAVNAAQAVHFLCNSAGTDFYVGGFRFYSATSGSLDLGTNSEINDLTNFNLHSKTYLHAYPTNDTAIIGNWDGANAGWMLSIDPTGRPTFQMGATKIQGETIVPLNTWSTIGARVEPGYVEILHDGETSGIGEPAFAAGVGDTYIGTRPSAVEPVVYPGALTEVRISQEDWSAADLAYNYVRNMVPTFKCAYEPELDADTLVYLTFNQTRGLIENKGSLYNPIIPWNVRRFVYRGIEGVIGKGIRIYKDVYNRGYLRIPLFTNLAWLDSPFAIEGDVHWSQEAANQTLISVGNWTDDGFQVRKTSDGYLQYHYKDTVEERQVTSSATIATTGYKHFTIVHDRTDNSVEMKIDGSVVGTLAAGVAGTMAAAPSDLYVGSMVGTGEGVWVHLDNLKIQGNATGEYSEAYPWTTQHWTPDETVYVGGDALHADRVDHTSPYRKLVVMPSHTPGYVDTRVVGSEFLPVDPYNYVFNYQIQLNTGDYEAKFGSTRSPFRIMGAPPEHSLKIAMIGTTPMSVETHTSITDLSDREPSNRTGYGIPIAVLRGNASHIYEDAIDTDEILVSNKSAMWQTLIAPKPLFYKYLIGRARHYVYVPTAPTSDDIDPIRKVIRLSHVNSGAVLGAWDIEVSDLDYYGETLPTNVYSVVLLLEQIPDRTMWVNYPAVHFRKLTGASDNMQEIVNPVPLFGTHSGRMGITTTINELGSYDVEVDT